MSAWEIARCFLAALAVVRTELHCHSRLLTRLPNFALDISLIARRNDIATLAVAPTRAMHHENKSRAGRRAVSA